MSSSTSPPDAAPQTATEHEPLLGRPGDVAQAAQDPLCKNLITGTAPLAQVGVLTLFALVWGGVFTHKLLVFSAHPLLNATGVLFATQAVLLLQPTHTAAQKKAGTRLHAMFLALALSALYSALAIVLWHKQRTGIGHFESPHAVLGVSIYVLLLLQAFVGVTQYFFPGLYGGVDKAKALYKYHRVGGYTIVTLLLVNVVLASYTFYGSSVLKIKSWGAIIGVILVVAGVAPRIKKQKVQLCTRHSGVGN